MPHSVHNVRKVRRLPTRCYGISNKAKKITARLFLDHCLRDDVRVLVRGVSGEEVDKEEECKGADTVYSIASDVSGSESVVVEVVVVDYDYQFSERADPEDGRYGGGEVGVLFGRRV